MITKRYWVYEVDSFMGTEITPEKAFYTRVSAEMYAKTLTRKTRVLGQYLGYYVLKTEYDESFIEAHKRMSGGRYTGKYAYNMQS